jgi:Ca2+-binding EF-hand superfamily protein
MRTSPAWPARAAWLLVAGAALSASVSVSLLPTPAAAQEAAAEFPDYVFVVGPEEEDLDVVIFGASRPALVRFRVRINDRGFRTAWEEFTARLFGYLDDDGDNVLTPAEAGRGGWPQALSSGRNGFFFNNDNRFRAAPVVDPTALDADPKDGRVSFGELSRFVRETLGYPAPGTQSGAGPDPRTQAAFTQLDRDGDGTLTSAELAAAEGLIGRLDTDADEMIALAELRPYDSPYTGFDDGSDSDADSDPGSAVVVPDSSMIVPLTSAEVRARVGRRLVSRYGGDPFERFLDKPVPGLVVVVRLGQSPRSGSTIEVAGPGDAPGPQPLASKVKKTKEGALVLDLDGTEIHLGLNDSLRDLRKFLELRFKDADANNDDAIDRKEAERSRIFQGVFNAADRNGDDRVARRELTGYLDLSYAAAEGRLMLTAADAGRSIFESLDADSDRRLSRRELRDAARKLKGRDGDNDGRIALAEVPKTFRLDVGRGPAARQRNFNFDDYDSPEPGRKGAKEDAVSWFRRMDRNQDGDVSPREFLGTAADFRKLDRDGDGLIDAGEAAKGP